MAASGGPVQDLREEATCPICLEYFRDPVIIPECGHNFCRSCLVQCWGESEGEASCPQCRERVEQNSIRKNLQLANFVEIIQKFNHPQGKEEGEGKGRVCEKHQEPLKLFCKEDQSPICVVCNVSKEHKSHEVVPLEEASQEYKDQISSCLDNVRKEREKILVFKANTEKESQDLLVSTIVTILSLIREMEEKLQEPESELLQDIGSFLQRSQEKENLEDPLVAFPPALKWRIWDFRDINPFLEGVMKKFRENVTLDPDTAHPRLILSDDRKSVSWGGVCQDLPKDPGRFDTWPYVMGCEGFTAGRHFWEISVGSEWEWAVGVARESVKRKGKFIAGPKERIWRIGKWSDQYTVSTRNGRPVLILGGEPKRIRVTLNCEGGRVSLYDADTAALLYSFSVASFSGETLQPFFY
ncbi:E3 ubiquitin-protein ligase TRIM7-like, partial [Podarcis lilfordi]